MDDQVKKRLAGAAVVLLLGFALVSLLPQAQDTPAGETQVVTIALNPELISTPDAPPASETTPSSLQSPAGGNESLLNPAELAAASGGDDDAPPDSNATGKGPAGAEAAGTPPALETTKPAVAPAPASEHPSAAKSADKTAGKPADKAAEKTEKAEQATDRSADKAADQHATAPAKAATPPGAGKPPAVSALAAKPQAKPATAPAAASAKPSPPALKPAPASAAASGQDAAKAAPAAPRGGNWFVQIGGYADIDNARQAQKQVRSHNQDCIIAPVDTNKGTIYRVRAGPYLNRETAQAAQTRLAAAGFASAALVAP